MCTHADMNTPPRKWNIIQFIKSPSTYHIAHTSQHIQYSTKNASGFPEAKGRLLFKLTMGFEFNSFRIAPTSMTIENWMRIDCDDKNRYFVWCDMCDAKEVNVGYAPGRPTSRSASLWRSASSQHHPLVGRTKAYSIQFNPLRGCLTSYVLVHIPRAKR